MVSTVNGGGVPVLCAPMGWGKSTYFLIYLYQLLKLPVFITLPTQELALALRADIQDMVNKLRP